MQVTMEGIKMAIVKLLMSRARMPDFEGPHFKKGSCVFQNPIEVLPDLLNPNKLDSNRKNSPRRRRGRRGFFFLQMQYAASNTVFEN